MFILFSAWALAADIQVGDTPLTRAVKNAQSGDRLILKGKTYKACLNLDGKDLSFISDGSAILDGGGRCQFAIVADLGEKLSLSGLTLKNAKMGGIHVTKRKSSLNVANVTFSHIGNSRSKYSAIRLSGGEAYIENSRFTSNTAQKGSAIFADKGAKLLIYSSLFSQNSSLTGAAIYGIDNVNLEIRKSRFVSNQTRSGGIGGAIAIRRNAKLVIQDTRFQNNRSQGLAGAVYMEEDTQNGVCELRISKSVFHGNSASFGTGAGGALYIRNKASVYVSDSEFNQNKAANHGGAIYLYDTQGQVDIAGTQFANNQSRSGGGGAIYASARANLRKVKLTVSQSHFRGNSAATYGGAISMGDTINATGDLTLKETSFKQNKAKSSRSGAGGAVYMNGSQPSRFAATNVQFDGNLAEIAGGGLYVNGSGTVSVDKGRFVNNKAEGLANIQPRFGGGMMITRVNRLHLSDSFFCNNKVSHRGGKNGPKSTGGALYGQQIREASVNNSTLLENHSQRSGGGMGMLDIGELNLNSLTLVGNQSIIGGGIQLQKTMWILNDSLLAHTQLGGGIVSEIDAKAMKNNVFFENTGGHVSDKIKWNGALEQNPELKLFKIDGRCQDDLNDALPTVGAQ